MHVHAHAILRIIYVAMTKMICNLIGLHKNKTAEGAHNQENAQLSTDLSPCERVWSEDETRK